MPQVSRTIVMFCACLSQTATSLSVAAWEPHETHTRARTGISFLMVRIVPQKIRAARAIARWRARLRADGLVRGSCFKNCLESVSELTAAVAESGGKPVLCAL